MKKKKGFTLIEMIASMAMLVLIFSVIASLMLLAIKTNVRNEKDLDSNSVSKAFVELINTKKNNEISKIGGIGNILTSMNGKTYLIKFDYIKDKDKNLANEFKTFISAPNSGAFDDDGKGINSVSETNEKYAIKVKVEKVKDSENRDTDTYKLIVNSWELNSINTSKINREVYINYIGI